MPERFIFDADRSNERQQRQKIDPERGDRRSRRVSGVSQVSRVSESEGSDKVDLNNYAAKKTAAAGQALFTLFGFNFHSY